MRVRFYTFLMILLPTEKGKKKVQGPGEGVLGPALDPGVIELAEVGAGLSEQAAAGHERGVGHGGLAFGHDGPPE